MRSLFVAALLAIPVALFSQPATDGNYQMPPREISEVVDAAPPPLASPSPDGKLLLLVQQPPLLTISDLSAPELKLAGVRFNPETHDQARLFYATSLTLVNVAPG